MNPRQRRGVVLMIVAGIGAIAVFFSVLSYVNSVQSRLGEYRTVMRLTQDVAAYEPVTSDMVEATQVPAGFFSETFITDLAEVGAEPGTEEIVAATPLKAGSMLQTSMLIPAPTLETGEREIAIMVDAETGVAGKVHQGSIVDIYGTYSASGNQPACAIRVLTEVQVLEIGEIQDQVDANTGQASGVVPVTFRLNATDALRLTYSEAFSGKLRLALVSQRGGGDPGIERFCSDTNLEEPASGGDTGAGGTP
ncbi:Flp pilus assembly protein CpaB [Salinactinospora qingdaonensis]|uniref:Flp pilus assembly protein CpaB n=1 Tax=Salinactinospora qingdaonensis TaxID=702744 RepID=A0ABP7EVK7_9ACTN